MNYPWNAMDVHQNDLYQRIQAFSFDQPGTRLSFGQRLTRENGWTADYAQWAIAEYRKFAFLAVAAGHPVTPSDAVDQVWHLHLSYTRSYWQEFCPHVLQMPLHHEPTQGGAAEQTKYGDWYRRTLESYERFFGQVPPVEVWSKPDDRFGRDLQFLRVNTQQNWVIAKPMPLGLKLQSVIFFLGLLLAGCQTTAFNPLNFRGSDFLWFYGLLSISVIMIANRIRSMLRLPDGDSAQIPFLDLYATAYLAKDTEVEAKTHVVDTAIASLVQKGIVTVDGRRLTVAEPAPVDQSLLPIEQDVMRAIGVDARLGKIRSAVKQATDRVRERLIMLELLMSPQQDQKARRFSMLPILGLLVLGIAKIIVGLSRGKPVGFLVTMCIVLLIIGLCFGSVPTYRSRYGDRVIKSIRSRMSQKGSTLNDPLDPELPLIFAVMGMTVLPDAMFGDLKRSLKPQSSGNGGGSYGDSGGGDSGSGDSGGGCGGGGCGGGGCGGCGGG
jgi:uncharacterized protein (TIGR04222 family)